MNTTPKAANIGNVPAGNFVTTNNAAKNIANNSAGIFKSASASLNSAATSMKNGLSNAAENTANSIKNTISNIKSPIKESINASFEGETSPYFSVPIIILLGVVLILFIVFIMFREQITYTLENAWRKLKEIFGYEKEGVRSPSAEYERQEHRERHKHRKEQDRYDPEEPVPPRDPSLLPDGNFIEKILPGKKEVFNIASNKYKYSDAEPLCKAFGAELATYDQVKQAWDKGADWCNYGWIKGQSAVFPTQEATYQKLQAGPEDQRGACGITGVNGGYYDNPDMQFGVNCYGVKPAENDADVRHIMAKNSNLTPDALAYDKKVREYKHEMNQIPVNSFSTGTWSE
jgi:hypothetical protein